jgi:hypothetical protein
MHSNPFPVHILWAPDRLLKRPVMSHDYQAST